MADETLKTVLPPIKVTDNGDGTWSISIEDVNSDAILAAIVAGNVDLAALEVINTAIQAATEASAVGLAAIEVINTAMQALLGTIDTDIGFLRRVPIITPTTGNDTTIATLNPGAAYKLLGIRIHFGSALAAAETLTVTLNANAGGAYDVVLFSSDLGTAGITDVVIAFGGDEDFFVAGDQIVVALSANTGSDVWGCETIHELV